MGTRRPAKYMPVKAGPVHSITASASEAISDQPERLYERYNPDMPFWEARGARTCGRCVD